MAGARSQRIVGRRELLLTVTGAACLVVGVLVAVDVPEDSGPAWAMAVAGCLAAGVLLIGRVTVVLLRAARGAAP